MVAILGMTKDQIFDAVKQMYTDVANSPAREFHFPTGRRACEFVGYPNRWLNTLPETAVESFAGVGFPFRAGVIQEGDRVLDIGAGSGTDTLLAAQMVGPQGRVFALDMTSAMLAKLRSNVSRASTENVEVLEGNAESIPLPDASVDVITSNGVLNLVPAKPQAFAEMFRVLRPGGRVQIADIVVSQPVSEKSRSDPKLWAECVVGAVIEDDYLDLFRAAGFTDVRVLRSYDYFSGSASPDTRRIAGALGGHAVEIAMQKPAVGRSAFATWIEKLRPQALVRRAERHGLLAFAAAGAALVACYGLLALVVVLGLLGLSVPLNEGLWAGLIALFSTLVPVALAWNRRRHNNWGPALLAAFGAAAIIYAMLGIYDWRLEAGGFVVLFAAAFWDRALFRRVAHSDRTVAR